MAFDYLEKQNFRLDLDNKDIKVNILFQVENDVLMETLNYLQKSF